MNLSPIRLAAITAAVRKPSPARARIHGSIRPTQSSPCPYKSKWPGKNPGHDDQIRIEADVSASAHAVRVPHLHPAIAGPYPARHLAGGVAVGDLVERNLAARHDHHGHRPGGDILAPAPVRLAVAEGIAGPAALEFGVLIDGLGFGVAARAVIVGGGRPAAPTRRRRRPSLTQNQKASWIAPPGPAELALAGSTILPANGGGAVNGARKARKRAGLRSYFPLPLRERVAPTRRKPGRCRVRGNGCRRRTPHPPRGLRPLGTLSHKGRGKEGSAPLNQVRRCELGLALLRVALVRAAFRAWRADTRRCRTAGGWRRNRSAPRRPPDTRRAAARAAGPPPRSAPPRRRCRSADSRPAGSTCGSGSGTAPQAC